MHPAGFFIVLIIYFLATLSFSFRLVFNQRSLTALALRITLVGFVLHLIFLVVHLISQGYPFLISRFDALQLTSLTIVFVFLLLCFFYKFSMTGIVILPVALVFYVVSLTLQADYRNLSAVLQNPWAFAHLLLIFMSLALFMVSFVVGILYLAAESRIKQKITGGFFERFPSLETLDRIHYRGLYIAFVFYTLGIFAGAGWSKSSLGVYVTNDLKELLSIGIWAFFALFLNLRVPQGWIGRKGIVLSSIGFLGLILLVVWNT